MVIKLKNNCILTVAMRGKTDALKRYQWRAITGKWMECRQWWLLFMGFTTPMSCEWTNLRDHPVDLFPRHWNGICWFMMVYAYKPMSRHVKTQQYVHILACSWLLRTNDDHALISCWQQVGSDQWIVCLTHVDMLDSKSTGNPHVPY